MLVAKLTTPAETLSSEQVAILTDVMDSPTKHNEGAKQFHLPERLSPDIQATSEPETWTEPNKKLMQ